MNGAGSIYQRGKIWWVQIYQDGKPVIQSSKSTKKAEAVKFRNRLLGKKSRGELSGSAILINELLDDVLKSDIEESTRYIWKLVVEKNLRPAFGKLKPQRLSTDHMDAYREKRKAQGRSDATVNRELSIYNFRPQRYQGMGSAKRSDHSRGHGKFSSGRAVGRARGRLCV
jgi:hypothetical protein